MNSISDITEGELRVVRTTLEERYGRVVDAQPGDAETRLDVADRGLTARPVSCAPADQRSFAVFETADRRHRARFIHRGFQHCGTGVREYGDPTECSSPCCRPRPTVPPRERGDLPEKRR